MSQKPWSISKRAATKQSTTKALIDDLVIRKKILELFDQWDDNDNGRLDITEIVYHLHLTGLIVDNNEVVKHISRVSPEMNGLTNEQFEELLFSDILLGNLNQEGRFAAIDVLLNGLRNKISIAEQMRALKEKVSKEMEKEAPTTDDDANIFDETFDQIDSCCKKFWNWFTGNLTAQTLIIVSVWWLVASLIYTWTGFEFYHAIYYSLQAGFSIGFGALSELKHGGVNLYEVCAQEGNATHLMQMIAAAQASPSEYKAHGSTIVGTKGTLCGYQYIPNEYRVWSMIWSIIHITIGASVIGGALSLFSANAIESSGSWLDEIEVTNDGRCKAWFKANLSAVKASVYILTWTLAGGVAHMLLEESDFWTGWYFAVAACSTGGLAGPSPLNKGSIIFSAVFVLFGVPLWGNALGQFANVCTKKYLKKKQLENRKKAISEVEYNHVASLVDSDGTISKLEFVYLSLLRTGKCSPDDLMQIEHDFTELDADGNGEFSPSELQASQVFDKCDKDGEVGLDALKNIVRIMQETRNVEHGEEVFLLDPKRVYTDHQLKKQMKRFNVVSESSSDKESDDDDEPDEPITLNRKEFMQWWNKSFNLYLLGIGASNVVSSRFHLQTLLKVLG
eukprot:CAMPEP_0175163112 /NCGR_PEP_ID=MMETSP0087-20121206/25548_1 /TAXON_ID=136419 /ORGANISM="Unknown Unknown, Strain D1" /LENGTH=619 /DNA_ID=CAMNT_0016451739 /DNA_START=17 /DNA_END=1872 /DNA_ORIENTATION=-